MNFSTKDYFNKRDQICSFLTKSAVSYRFGHIYWRNPYHKISFFVQWAKFEDKYEIL